MNRRKSAHTSRRPSLRGMLQRTHLRLALLAMGLTSLPLALISLLALSTYASQNLQLTARSTAYALEAAVVFKDREAIHEAIEHLLHTEDIARVAVYDAQGTLLASRQNNQRHLMGQVEKFIANALMPNDFIATISDNGQLLGTLQLCGQGRTLLRYLLSGLLALLASLGLTSLGVIYGSRRMQRAITQPLGDLSQVAHNISMDRTFNQRVPAPQIAEFHELAYDFNALLDQLEAWQHQLQHENASLAHQASHDGLTGLPNRAFFESRLLRAMREARDGNSHLAVLYMDSNKFKDINDRLGHAAGDAVLVAIAQRLQAQLREDDIVARLGGDEFAVLLKPIYSESDALSIADKIIDNMQLPITLPDGSDIITSLSIGIALYPEHADSPDALVHEADVAMYQAKRNHCGPTMAKTRCADAE
ncbi:diguanylate cyclase domain-containing protein [Pseudomonas sp. 5P_3.1_Bac2]|uniref:diguanylate cyclase domain-containing protein n=1 Tax=Pseudomonas sp. 5P_3.1_Bac2 TaxID=2971617 RepID=UPI0021C6E529|nr:diguanylate cyclase [Pseudomonas sp. 5P_3.1_Bac2]MCU1717532.1 diguanylate cyclase [Pseudomonas sp. 5P_3.1_Bac2]